MATRNLDDQIRDYYASQKASPETIERVKQMIRGGTPKRQPRRSWLVAAAAILLAAVALVWSGVGRDVPSPKGLAEALAHQAALGHNEKQELEFQATDCAELQRKMKSLDFTLVEPAMMHPMNMRIAGARYTTIGGQMAAQIVYVDAKGTPCTLFEVRPTGRLALVAAGEHQVDGVRISVWREKGLVMVLARPMA